MKNLKHIGLLCNTSWSLAERQTMYSQVAYRGINPDDFGFHRKS